MFPAAANGAHVQCGGGAQANLTTRRLASNFPQVLGQQVGEEPHEGALQCVDHAVTVLLEQRPGAGGLLA